jgi:Met-zincin/Domain of unknown function (DUF5117)
MRRISVTGWAIAICLATAAGDLRAQERRPENRIDLDEVMTSTRVNFEGGPGEPGATRLRDFTELTRGAQKIDGLFTLYQKGDHLYAEIRTDQFNQPLLLPITIARGLGQAGMPASGMFDERVFVFKRVGDRVQLIRRNIHYKAPSGTPIDKSVQQNYVDSIVMSLPVISQNTRNNNSPVIDFSDIFLTNFAELPLGSMDRTRSGWHRVKGFAHNLELEVEATFSAGRGGYYSMFGEADGVADSRGITLVIHYSLMKTPDQGYHPRTADDRVGHFLSASKDFGKADADTNFVRQVNRWRLEKADPKAELSPPKKQIIWYIEDTVPIEYRPFVEAGIREWNKAFEKIGFIDAMAVRWQEQGRDEFDPEDTNYCTFRWVTSDGAFAMSCLRANPLTGEMIDGDVVFDASFIRYWKQSYALLVGTAATPSGELQATPLAMGEIISPILAAKMGYGNPAASGLPGAAGLKGPGSRLVPEAIPADLGGIQWQLGRTRADSARSGCQFHSGLSRDFSLAALVFSDTPKPQTEGKPEPPKDELPREFVGQAIKHIVMHEVGHSLGLRHNFKASTMLNADQLNDTSITRVKGLVGSVMDYSPINIAPKGKKQGDFYSTTIGPYDYWAIEYAYKPIDGNEDEQLKKIAARAPEADLVYATDEDVWSNGDPQVNRFDLGSDPCQFAKDRIAMASGLLKELDAKVVKDGESWARTRKAFGILLGEWGNGAILASQYVGGQSVSRDHKGDKGAHEPIVPVAGAKQRECLAFLSEQILSEKAFQFSPALLRRLGTEKWMHWGSYNAFGSGADISVLETVLAIQKIVLSESLSSATLRRLQNQQLQADPGADPLRMEEVFRTMTDGIWSDLCNPAAAGDNKASLSTLRRNLQREYVRRLSTMVIGESPNSFGDQFSYIAIRMGGEESIPADARALARLHLGEIGERIDKALDRKDVKIDDTTKAHLKECRQRITKVLEAGLDVREP